MEFRDLRPEMARELHALVDEVARKPNGVRSLSLLIDQAAVLAEYKSNRGSITSRMRRPRCKETYKQQWEDDFFGRK